MQVVSNRITCDLKKQVYMIPFITKWNMLLRPQDTLQTPYSCNCYLIHKLHTEAPHFLPSKVLFKERHHLANILLMFTCRWYRQGTWPVKAVVVILGPTAGLVESSMGPTPKPGPYTWYRGMAVCWALPTAFAVMGCSSGGGGITV